MTDQSFNDDMFGDEIPGAGPTIFKKLAEWEVGEVVTGVFLETYTTYGPPDKPFKDPATKHRIMIQLDGTVLDTGSCVDLSSKLQNVKQHQFVRIEYQGKQLIESGPNQGKESYVFSVRPGKPGIMPEWVEKAKTLPAFDPTVVYRKKKSAVEGPADLFADGDQADAAPIL